MWPRRRFCSCPIGRVQFHRSARRIEGQARYPGPARFERRPSLAPGRPSRLQRTHRSRPTTRLEQGFLAGHSRRRSSTIDLLDRPSRRFGLEPNNTARHEANPKRRGQRPPSETNHGRTSARAIPRPGCRALPYVRHLLACITRSPLSRFSSREFSTQLP
jgi:hypothetical protein